ncbi:MAG: Alfa-L-rhamnosidase [Akkermansiaceae bacterium]|nr:Alfa-L-rhamnosidase [Akkermansiaceae bacterium]
MPLSTVSPLARRLRGNPFWPVAAAALFTTAAATLRADAVLQVSKLRSEYLVDPIGLDQAKPRLSWLVDSLTRGDRQTAWQVIVASTPELLAADSGDLWDSGKMTGDTTSQIAYGGAAMGSRAVAYWKVRSWDKDGAASAWSVPAKWSVGLLQNSDWTAKWIDGTIVSPPADPGAAIPVILAASYRGTTGTGALDVKARLIGMLGEGTYAISVNNGTFGSDPAYNIRKELYIQYQLGGVTFSKTFGEDSGVLLPGDLQGATNAVVTSARYESVANPATAFRDVTTVLTSKPAGPYTVQVSNAAFGPDPAPNQVKQLRINYTANGVPGVLIKAENTTFNYPIDLPRPVVAALTAARYEAANGSGTSVDVLAKLNTLGAGGGYSLTVNNATFGGTDPSLGNVKRLRLEFTRDGKNWVKFVPENRGFTFPGDLAQANNLPYVRKSFTLTKPVRSATLYATALGLYELQLNGTRVGDHTLAPEWTDYTKRLNYQAYDVTGQLASGANVLGAQVANGYYSGKVGSLFQYWGGSSGLMAQLEVTYQDGSTEKIVTDGTWKMAQSPILATDVQVGEDYDARKEVAGWSTAAVSDADWTPVILRGEAQRPISGQRMEPVRQLMEITPQTVSQPAPGKWTFNMGQNMVGVLRLKVNAPAGTRITLRHGERLNTGGAGSDGPAGTVYTANLRTAVAIDTYICKGTGDEIWTPKFTFHGFQYVELTGLATQPGLDAVTGIVFASDTAETGDFACSDGSINQLMSNIKWGQRGNYLSVPTDCPQRDERLGWTGDAQVFVKTATYNADIAAFHTKWLADLTDDQLTTGAVPDVAPQVTVSYGTPAWADAVVICPWTIYQAYGDKQILANNYAAMKSWIAYCKTNSLNSIRDRGRGSDYGDWLSIGVDTDKELIGTAYYAYSTRLVAKAAAALGNTADAATYEALFQTIKTAFNNKYVNQTTGVFNTTATNTQCAYAMALKFELLSDALKPKVATLLENDVIAKGNHLSTGFVGVSYLLPALTGGGKNETAYELLTQDTFPSWLFSVRNGATTIWERWDGWTPDAGFQTPAMNSFNHYSLGSCGEWLYSSVAGIDQEADSAGYKKIVIRPQPGGTMSSAAGSFVSMNGLIESSWRKYTGGFVLNTTIPANTTATIYVPAGSVDEVMESGVPVAQVEGITALGMEGGAAKFAVGAGRYSFTTGSVTEPGTDEVSHDSGTPLDLRIATLLANDGSGPYEFVSAGPLSVNGAAITVVNGMIHYAPPAGSTGPDSFTYVIRDAAGGVFTRTVQVGIIPAGAPVQTAVSITALPDRSLQVVFSGVPGRIYRIQSSETMDGEAAWTTRATVQAGEDGRFEMTDAAALPAARFYRAVFP